VSGENKIYDCIIIGAGPSGVQAALYLIRANKSVVVFHSYELGALNNAEWVENFYAQGKIKGKQLYKKGIEELKKFGASVLDFKVTKISQNFDSKTFIVGNVDKSFETKSIIIAFGKENKKSNYIINATEKVSYCATCDGFFYKNKNVALVGNKELAYEEYNHLVKIVKEVTILTNSNNLCSKFSKDTSINKKKILEINNTNNGLIKIIFEDGTSLYFDGVFIAEGDYSINSLGAELGVVTKNQFINVDENMQTNISGVFACGDAIGGIFQVAKAVNDGMKAGMSVIKFLN